MSHQGFGFCEFFSEEDAEYACRIMNGIKLFGKPIRVNKVGSPLLYPQQKRASTSSMTNWLC